MDGRYLNNVFIERLWRTLKQGAIYLEEITDGFKPEEASETGLPSTTPRGPTQRLIGKCPTRHIGLA